jgi:hypothetical protein
MFCILGDTQVVVMHDIIQYVACGRDIHNER